MEALGTCSALLDGKMLVQDIVYFFKKKSYPSCNVWSRKYSMVVFSVAPQPPINESKMIVLLSSQYSEILVVPYRSPVDFDVL